MSTPDKIIEAEDIGNLRLDERIKEELYDLKDTAEKAGALRSLLNSEGWQELKEIVLEDVQTALLAVITNWKEGNVRGTDVAIARLEQLITLYSTVQGSGKDEKEAQELLAQRVKEIVGEMG